MLGLLEAAKRAENTLRVLGLMMPDFPQIDGAIDELRRAIEEAEPLHDEARARAEAAEAECERLRRQLDMSIDRWQEEEKRLRSVITKIGKFSQVASIAYGDDNTCEGSRAAEAEVARLRRLINEIVIAYNDDENLSALDVAIGRASALAGASADDD